ncbi:MAG TPA: hypothetical protein VGR15_01595, partial [Bacteroidota bacterium]|nr:hypothetical protein [Bacteroidota bacterium]
NFSYKIFDDQLLLTNLAGGEIRLRREHYGLNEEKLIARYYTGYDTTDREEMFSFSDDGRFNYAKYYRKAKKGLQDDELESRSKGKARLEGVYRIEDDFVILTFSNQRVKEALLRYGEDESNVESITLDGQDFDLEWHSYLAEGRGIHGYRDPDPPSPPWPPDPPCYCCDPPPPPPPPDPIPCAGPTVSQSQPVEVRTHRDSGSTRGQRPDNR